MEALIKRLQAIRMTAQELKHSLKAKDSELENKDKEIIRLRRLIDIQNSSIKELEGRLKMKRLAEEISGEGSDESGPNRDLKFKINEMIKEVDKIMTFMHQ